MQQYLQQAKFAQGGIGPRERLAEGGIELLNNAELLAIIFNTGSRKESVLDLANRVIRDYGLTALAQTMNYRTLAKGLDLTDIKAMQLLSVLELGRRIFLERRGNSLIFNTAVKVYTHFKHLETRSKEEVRAVFLNSRQVLIAVEVLAIGSLDYVQVSMRDVLGPALMYGAKSVILVHNHPSGDESPSQADIDFTKRVHGAAQLFDIQLQDHLIIGQHYYSFQESGVLKS